jgi:hypothetical protein
MKPDSQVRFCIIGLGNLMEVIWHCLAQNLGGDDLAQRAIATTADKDDIERKREVFKIPVQLQGNLEALKANRPDIIFFAPPPTIAPGEIDTTLREYFAWVREKGLPIPEIYAFPPVPLGQYYHDVLGDDVLVSNIIPNNVSRIAGQPVEDEGYYACSFTGDWPAESKDRLLRIFSSQGAMVETPVNLLVPMLGGTCTFFALWQVVPVLAEILQKNGHDINHNQIGEYLRARCQTISGYTPEASAPASPDSVSGPVTALLDAMLIAWRDGVIQYYEQIGFPPKSTQTIVERGYDVILHTVQMEPRKVLDDHAIGAATKGGVLEKAINTFHQLIKPLLKAGVKNLPSGVDPKWQADIATKVNECAHIVGRHGQKLAG